MSQIKLLAASLFLLLIAQIQVFGQQKFTISGYVKDEATGEFLPGANAYIKESMQGTATNAYGFYSLTLPAGQYTLVISFLGYNDIETTIDLKADIRKNVSLGSKAIQAKEVVITETRIENNVNSTDMGRVELQVEQMIKLPALFV